MKSLLCVTTLVLAACTQKPLDIIAKNKSPQRIDDFVVTFAKTPCTFGSLVDGATAGMMDFPYQVKEPVLASWTDMQGVKHSQNISLPPIDRSRPGELVFTFGTQGVTVKFQDRFHD